MESIRTIHSLASAQAGRLSRAGLSQAVLLTAIVVGTSLGCGGSNDRPLPKAGSGGGAAGHAGKAGSSASAAGSTGSTGAVSCGSSQCSVAANPLAGLLGAAVPASVACCVDEAKGTCGTAAMTGATCEPPATADPRCPGIDLGALAGLTAMFGAGAGGVMTGCCVNNACGLDGMLLGRGCVENSEAKTALAALPVIGTLINVPAPIACDHPDTDSGVEDAGL
jgi:hypothetical protein